MLPACRGKSCTIKGTYGKEKHTSLGSRTYAASAHIANCSRAGRERTCGSANTFRNIWVVRSLPAKPHERDGEATSDIEQTSKSMNATELHVLTTECKKLPRQACRKVYARPRRDRKGFECPRSRSGSGSCFPTTICAGCILEATGSAVSDTVHRCSDKHLRRQDVMSI